MTQGLTLRVCGNSSLIVPRSAHSLSTYVLLEQEDWFEKEIAFVRRLLRPGMRAIDVGANFGCYSVAISQAIGPTGILWLYEPASTTFDYLTRTLQSNDFTWARAHRIALSDHEGNGTLWVGENSELNSLGRNDSTNSKQETVRLMTLDRARITHSIDSVDFVKLDAEGEEARIVAGAQEFFRVEDPLVMFEVKHGMTINADLATSFRRLGYRIFRLVGPDTVLVPVEAEAQLDGFELNLFACKPRRAALLAALGFLVEGPAPIRTSGDGQGLKLWRLQSFAPAFGARVDALDVSYAGALDQYAMWRDPSRTPAQRYTALDAALREVIDVVARAMTLPRLFTLVRIAREAGARSVAVQGLQRINEVLRRGAFAPNEPCWPALERYDHLDPKSSAGPWLTASAAEALTITPYFSGYFSGPIALPMLDWLHDSPYANAPMERRRELQSIFAGRQSLVKESTLLQRLQHDNLNPQCWETGTNIFHETV